MLGHRASRITTHYSSAELTSLIAAAEKVCDSESPNSPATSGLRRRAGTREPQQDVVSQENMARPERFELPTTWFVARYSIQLSYGRADNTR